MICKAIVYVKRKDHCAVATLKNDNKHYVNGFKKVGEKVYLINSDYEQVIQSILDNLI